MNFFFVLFIKKRIIPFEVADYLGDLFGLTGCMDNFVGRKKDE